MAHPSSPVNGRFSHAAGLSPIASQAISTSCTSPSLSTSNTYPHFAVGLSRRVPTAGGQVVCSIAPRFTSVAPAECAESIAPSRLRGRTICSSTGRLPIADGAACDAFPSVASPPCTPARRSTTATGSTSAAAPAAAAPSCGVRATQAPQVYPPSGLGDTSLHSSAA